MAAKTKGVGPNTCLICDGEYDNHAFDCPHYRSWKQKGRDNVPDAPGDDAPLTESQVRRVIEAIGNMAEAEYAWRPLSLSYVRQFRAEAMTKVAELTRQANDIK